MRFPAAGRRKRSFDSMLHAFARRTSPARFRRTSVLRFVNPLRRHIVDFRTGLLSTTASAALQRQRFLASKLGYAAALTASWREVLNCRGAAPTSYQNISNNLVGKRRFAPLPVTLLYIRRQRIAGIQQPRNTSIALRALCAGALRRALRRRRNERAFIDLRKSVLQRRTPKERALRPGKLRRRARLKACSRAKQWRRHNVASTVA